MTTPNIFISHRWAYPDDYNNLVSKFDYYGFKHLNYSVPEDDPLENAERRKAIENGLREQIKQCNYFIIFANMGMAYSHWCKYEVDIAKEYNKPILSISPRGYAGNTPLFIQMADTENGPVGFQTPAIIRKICSTLNHPLPNWI